MEISPSQGLTEQWNIIWYDVLFKLRLKLNTLTLNHLQLYNTMSEILSAAFGGKKDKDNAPVKINDLSADAAIATMNNVFQMAGNG